MRFNPKARLDCSQIETARRWWRPRGGGAAIGGNLPISVLRRQGRHRGDLVVVVDRVSSCSTPCGGGGVAAARPGRLRQLHRRAGQHRRNCRLELDHQLGAGLLGRRVPREGDRASLHEIKTVPFTPGTTDGCGSGQASAVGPVLLPQRPAGLPRPVLLRQTCSSQLGGKDTAFTEAYVVAHEYGHHIQNLMGLMGQGPHPAGAQLRLGQAGDHGRLPGRRLGQARDHDDGRRRQRADLRPHRDATSRRASPRPRWSATTPSSSAARAGSTPRTGRTARRPSGSRRSTSGMKQGTIEACNFFDSRNTNYPAS